MIADDELKRRTGRSGVDESIARGLGVGILFFGVIITGPNSLLALEMKNDNDRRIGFGVSDIVDDRKKTTNVGQMENTSGEGQIANERTETKA